MTMFAKKTFILTVFILLSTTLFSNEKRVIKFAPLPTKKASKNIEDFLPMNSYLKEKLSIDIKYVYKQDYQDILNGFKDGTIDMAYLGPLPFISLQKEYMFVKPIITFKQKSGSSKYRCVLAKFKNDKFDKEKQIKVALTQPLSTCGYLMTNLLLKENFNIELKEQKYDYTMSHTNALISVVKGEFLIAGAKDSIAKKYESLGMEIIAQSRLLPGFSLVVNTQTLSKEQIKEIEDALLGLPQETYKSWKGITKNGIEKANIDDYNELNVNFHIPKKGNMQ
ncbi:PhnD/SsuA/transferrin family substrate-binding protein [Sulfurimonas sp.]|uniref:PhnD/SsuA/transferrin family substrate-binding protein n=1 Tax=Sulfurimonas sp. TaxID=2022749 RepID=UPI003564721D